MNTYNLCMFFFNMSIWVNRQDAQVNFAENGRCVLLPPPCGWVGQGSKRDMEHPFTCIIFNMLVRPEQVVEKSTEIGSTLSLCGSYTCLDQYKFILVCMEEIVFRQKNKAISCSLVHGNIIGRKYASPAL